jgi:hypothetical protein
MPVLCPRESKTLFSIVVYIKSHDFLVFNRDITYDEIVITLAVLDIALVGVNPNKRGSVKLTTYAPIKASSLEGVGRLALLRFGVGLRSAIRFPYPLGKDALSLFGLNTYTDSAEQIALAFVMLSLPTCRANGLVKDIHIDSCILVKQKNKTFFLYALYANVYLIGS